MHELYNPVSQDDEELDVKGGKYQRKFAILQVTVRLPEYNIINWIAVVYGLLAFAVGLSFPVMWLATNRFCYLYGCFVQLVCIASSELFLKKLFKDPRPLESANRYPDGSMKYGMPSGHCMVTIAIMTWLLLELAFRDDFHQDWAIAVIILIAPIPWSRYRNMDHTLAQCIVGTTLGSIVGVSAYFIREQYFLNHYWPWHGLDQDIITVTEHTKLNHAVQQGSGSGGGGGSSSGVDAQVTNAQETTTHSG